MSEPYDPVVRDLWHVAGPAEQLTAGGERSTTLFGERVTLARDVDGTANARLAGGRALPVLERYGFVWTSLGEPVALFDIPEYAEPDRKNVCTGSVGIRVSAPRAIENFLDMGHFPFVHTGLLGEEPHTEVKEYTVTIDAAKDEVVATECRFWQPQAAAASTGGVEVEYVYRVPHPFCAVLYKTSAPDPGRFDVDRALRPAGGRGAGDRPSDDVDRRRGQHGRRYPPLPAHHLRPGQADPREPAAQAAAARSTSGNADPRRQVVDRLPPLAGRQGAALRRHSGCRLMLSDVQRRTFQPVASSADLVPRHVFAGRLWGQELALWRADDGHVNAWENRCLHRGVRLTIGVNLGHELMCQYHGWRYANRTASCTYIPAHPADAPARTICNRTYPVLERGGLVWAALDAAADPATIPLLAEGALVLRPLPLDVPASEVEAALAAAFAGEPVRFLVQPVDAGQKRCSRRSRAST